MPVDPRSSKSPKVGNITALTEFFNFSSLLLIDAGAADGFTLTDDAGNSCPIPTGVPISIGGLGSSCAYLKVTATPAASLNVSYILYQ